MPDLAKKLLIASLVIAAAMTVWRVDAARSTVYAPAVGSSPLFQEQLEQKLEEMEALAPGAVPTAPDLSRAAEEPAQQALIIFSEGVSACIASGCAASACAGSGCGASACAGSGCGGSACAGSACPGSICVGSACAGSGCAGSLCAGSGCGGSGCAGSGCLGSGCAASNCLGSACSGSNCLGSACSGCRGATDEATGEGGALAAAGSCPIVSPGVSAARFVSLDAEPTGSGVELRWIVSGAEVESYRIYRTAAGGGTPELLSKGPARSDLLTSARLAGASLQGATLLLEVTDVAGLPTSVELTPPAATAPSLTAAL